MLDRQPKVPCIHGVRERSLYLRVNEDGGLLVQPRVMAHEDQTIWESALQGTRSEGLFSGIPPSLNIKKVHYSRRQSAIHIVFKYSSLAVPPLCFEKLSVITPLIWTVVETSTDFTDETT